MKHIKLNARSIKVNPENYIAMTCGYRVDSKMVLSPIHISDSGPDCNFWNTYQKGKNDYFLLTCSKDTTHRLGPKPANSKVVNEWVRDGLCDVIRHRNSTVNIKNYYQHLYNYAVYVDQIYYINNDAGANKKLFQELCSNDLFNQWNYIAPCNRLMGKKCGNAQIGLFRIYNIRNPILRGDIQTYEKGNSRFWDELDDTSRDVGVVNPIIPDDEFDNMRIKLESTLKKHGVLVKTINP